MASGVFMMQEMPGDPKLGLRWHKRQSGISAARPRGHDRLQLAGCAKRSLRPLTVEDGPEGQFRRIDDDVLHLLALPGVGEMDESVLRLNDARVAVLLQIMCDRTDVSEQCSYTRIIH